MPVRQRYNQIDPNRSNKATGQILRKILVNKELPPSAVVALKVIDHAMRDCRVFPHKSNKGSRKFQPGIEVTPEELEEERLCLLDWLESDGDQGFQYWCAEARLTWAEHDELKEYMEKRLKAYA